MLCRTTANPRSIFPRLLSVIRGELLGAFADSFFCLAMQHHLLSDTHCKEFTGRSVARSALKRFPHHVWHSLPRRTKFWCQGKRNSCLLLPPAQPHSPSLFFSTFWLCIRSRRVHCEFNVFPLFFLSPRFQDHQALKHHRFFSEKKSEKKVPQQLRV